MQNRLKTYLDLVKRGLPNIDKIAEGVLNEVKSEFGLLKEDEQEEITRRKLICRNCPFYSLNAKEDDAEYKNLTKEPFEFDKLRSRYCGICGCDEGVKTSSLSANCGLEFYNQNNPNNKQELKWTKYETTK